MPLQATKAVGCALCTIQNVKGAFQRPTIHYWIPAFPGMAMENQCVNGEAVLTFLINCAAH